MRECTYPASTSVSREQTRNELERHVAALLSGAKTKKRPHSTRRARLCWSRNLSFAAGPRWLVGPTDLFQHMSDDCYSLNCHASIVDAQSAF